MVAKEVRNRAMGYRYTLGLKKMREHVLVNLHTNLQTLDLRTFRLNRQSHMFHDYLSKDLMSDALLHLAAKSWFFLLSFLFYFFDWIILWCIFFLFWTIFIFWPHALIGVNESIFHASLISFLFFSIGDQRCLLNWCTNPFILCIQVN